MFGQDVANSGAYSLPLSPAPVPTNVTQAIRDRAVRLARITAHAERVFGNDEKAHGWLREPSRTLGGTVPLDLLRTETGAQLVEQTLHRYDYGMLA